MNDEYLKMKKLLNEMSQGVNQKRILIHRIKNGEDTEKEERNKFIMPCSAENCKGYLSCQYKCGVCKLFTCPDCFEIIGYSKDEPHECKEENVKSAEMIKKETKGCPKCGVRIFKIAGCFASGTPILMYDGTIKKSENITIGDKLIGDDGNVRNVTHLTCGYDKMYNIQQNNSENYIVNSEHTLVLYYSGQGSISICNATSNNINYYKLNWFDIDSNEFKTKNFSELKLAHLFKSEMENNGFDFSKTINISVKNYLNLPESRKSSLKGIKLEKCVHWKYQNVNLDPYLLGLWLGDGYSNGKEFSTNDKEIYDYWEKWAFNNKSIVVKTTNKYRYYVKHIDNSSTGFASNNNVLKEKLNSYNLLNNKHIPYDYLINSQEVRLKLLAGLIDTDGYVCNHGRRIVIISVIEKLAKNIEFLAKSLGFSTNITIRKRIQQKIFDCEIKDYKDQYIINISGKFIGNIPTLLLRKKCSNQTGGVNLLTTAIKVTEIGYDNYYGWTLDNNHRFVLADFTLAKNCDQMWCTECKVAFSWNTGKIVVNGNIHNPHYYQYLQQNGLNPGTAPRNPGDVICGGLIPYYSMNGLVRFLNGFNLATWFDYFKKNNGKFATFVNENKIQNISELTTIMNHLHRLVNHISNVDLINCRNKVRTLENHDNLTVQYILNNKTKDELATAIFKNDILRKKSLELLNVYELLNVVGIERFNTIYDFYVNNNKKLTNTKLNIERGVCLTELFEKIVDLIVEYNGLLKYCNKQLSVISYTFNLSVGIITDHKHKYITIKKKCCQSDLVYYARYENETKSKSKKPIDVSGTSGSSGSGGALTGKNNSEASCSNTIM